VLEGQLRGKKERKRETEVNAIELAIADKRRKYGLCSPKRTGTRRLKQSNWHQWKWKSSHI